jgi:hypothetical protein
MSKKYLVLAQAKDNDIDIEFVSSHTTREEAMLTLDKCKEGDDKHDSCEYFIEERDL